MRQSALSKGKWSAASKEIPHILSKPKIISVFKTACHYPNSEPAKSGPQPPILSV
jgi:hypothetical protein